jgi:hypothetical protein
VGSSAHFESAGTRWNNRRETFSTIRRSSLYAAWLYAAWLYAAWLYDARVPGGAISSDSASFAT